MHVADCVVRNDLLHHPDQVGTELWDAIIVPDAIKERLRNHALLMLNLRPGLSFAASALHGLITLYGPPGTGKTTLARGLASQLAPYTHGQAVRLVEVNPHGLMSAEHGQSQQRVSELLSGYIPSLAEDRLPTVVVLDEVESMAVARSAASLAANPADVHRATDAVLTALDDNARAHPHLLVVATSNFTDALDQAFLSRSDATILVPAPDPLALARILADTLTQLGASYPPLLELATSPELPRIAQAAHGLDGRRARKVVFEALATRLDTVLDPGALRSTELLAAITAALLTRNGDGRAAGSKRGHDLGALATDRDDNDAAA